MAEWVSAATVMRRMPSILKWIRQGFSGPPPPTIKRIIIGSYLQRYGLSEFIETGTFRGDTLAWIARNGSTQYSSIELNSEFYRKGVGIENIEHGHGSGVLSGGSGA